MYVDDIIMRRDDLTEKQLLKERLAAKFGMNDLGLRCFLGIEVAYFKKDIYIS